MYIIKSRKQGGQGDTEELRHHIVRVDHEGPERAR